MSDFIITCNNCGEEIPLIESQWVGGVQVCSDKCETEFVAELIESQE